MIVCLILPESVEAAPAGVKPGDARRAALFRRTDAGAVSTARAPGSLAFLAPFQRPPETEGFRSGFDDVRSIRDPVQ